MILGVPNSSSFSRKIHHPWLPLITPPKGLTGNRDFSHGQRHFNLSSMCSSEYALGESRTGHGRVMRKFVSEDCKTRSQQQKLWGKSGRKLPFVPFRRVFNIANSLKDAGFIHRFFVVFVWGKTLAKPWK